MFSFLLQEWEIQDTPRVFLWTSVWLVACFWSAMDFFILLYQADHKPELNCYDSDWITPSYEHAMRRIRRFYSPSKSFLKIEPKPEMLSCGSPSEIQVHYIFTPEAIGEQKKIVLYYLVRIICVYFELWPQRALLAHRPRSHSDQTRHCYV